ncbi:uncharacterized protein TNCV_1218411 [Trichonephila clavipes]|nr:uncharacterized protein TNCV_1218411 [Trichonephila clavipes]
MPNAAKEVFTSKISGLGLLDLDLKSDEHVYFVDYRSTQKGFCGNSHWGGCYGRRKDNYTKNYRNAYPVLCKSRVPSRQGGTLISRRAARPLLRLGEEERWEASDHPQSVRPLNWGGIEPNCTVTCMVLKAMAKDMRHLALCHDEFRGPRSGLCRSGFDTARPPSWIPFQRQQALLCALPRDIKLVSSFPPFTTVRAAAY